MIGIGVGIDYVLFIVTRYRSALHSGLEPRAAVITAITTSGRAVIFAGCTVIISLLGLFVMNLGFLRGLAVGAVSAVLVVMLASVTLLPAMLGFIGHKIDRLRVPFVNRKESGDRRSLSYRWSRVVQRRPWPAAIICVVVLLALAAPARHMHFGFPDAGNSPETFTTRRAYDLLSRGFGPGFNGPLLLVATADGKDPAAAVAPVAAAVASDPDVRVREPAQSRAPTARSRCWSRIRSRHRKRRPPRTSSSDCATTSCPRATSGTGVTVFVGGSTGASVDATSYVADRLGVFIGVVIVLSFLLLLVVFRSLLVPLKAAIMNLLSVGAAYGVVAMVVQGGWLGGLFGIHEPVPIPSFIPMMMFAILFGLSMDYEVFLLSRIREEYARTGDNADRGRRRPRPHGPGHHCGRRDHDLGVPRLRARRPGLPEDDGRRVWRRRSSSTPPSCGWCSSRRRWSCSATRTGGCPQWLDRRLPRLHVEGESAETIEAELAELLHEEEVRSGDDR